MFQLSVSLTFQVHALYIILLSLCALFYEPAVILTTFISINHKTFSSQNCFGKFSEAQDCRRHRTPEDGPYRQQDIQVLWHNTCKISELLAEVEILFTCMQDTWQNPKYIPFCKNFVMAVVQ